MRRPGPIYILCGCACVVSDSVNIAPSRSWGSPIDMQDPNRSAPRLGKRGIFNVRLAVPMGSPWSGFDAALAIGAHETAQRSAAPGSETVEDLGLAVSKTVLRTDDARFQALAPRENAARR